MPERVITRWQHSLGQRLLLGAWPHTGLSPLNKALCVLIIISSVVAILETEDSFTAQLPRGFAAAELVFSVIFGIEYLARLWVVGIDSRYRGVLGRVRYMLTPMALIDLAAILPIYLGLTATDPLLLRMCRLLRILRLAKLGRYSTALQHLVEAVRSRRHELSLSVLMTVTVLIVSSTLVYFFEAEGQPQQFGSIPRTLWWSIVTLTTVGYGDVFPVTVPGRVLAGLTAISGVALIAVPTGILAAAFSDVFQKHLRTGGDAF